MWFCLFLDGGRLAVLTGIQLFYAGNGRTAETDLGAVAAGFDDQRIVLVGNGADDAHNAADGGDLIADFDRIAHSSVLFILTLLGQVHQNDHKDQQDHNGQEADDHLGSAGGTGSRQKLNHNRYSPYN